MKERWRQREEQDGYAEKEVEQVGGKMGVKRASFERMRVRDKVRELGERWDGRRLILESFWLLVSLAKGWEHTVDSKCCVSLVDNPLWCVMLTLLTPHGNTFLL